MRDAWQPGQSLAHSSDAGGNQTNTGAPWMGVEASQFFTESLMAFEVNLPPAQIAMFEELVAQMKENNIQTKRLADFLDREYAQPQLPTPPAKP